MQGQRVRELRKVLNLTLEKFGKPLGVGKAAISNIENNNRNLTDQMVLSICREYNVNEEWLRNGTGEMFTQVSVYEKAYNRFGYIMENASPTKKAALSVLLELLYSIPDEQWDLLIEEFDKIKKEG